MGGRYFIYRPPLGSLMAARSAVHGPDLANIGSDLAASWLWPLGVVTALLHLQERRRPPPSSSRSSTTRAGGGVPDGVPHLNLASPGPSVAGALASGSTATALPRCSRKPAAWAMLSFTG